MAEPTFDLFITADQNLRYQQNISGRKLAILELSTNDWHAIRSDSDAIQRIIKGGHRAGGIHPAHSQNSVGDPRRSFFLFNFRTDHLPEMSVGKAWHLRHRKTCQESRRERDPCEGAKSGFHAGSLAERGEETKGIMGMHSSQGQYR